MTMYARAPSSRRRNGKERERIYNSASCCASSSRPPRRRYALALFPANVNASSVSFVASSFSAALPLCFNSFAGFVKLL